VSQEINCFLRHPVRGMAAAIPTVVWAKPGRPAPRFLATGQRSRAVGIARPQIRDGPGHRQSAAGHGEVQDRDVALSRRGYGVKPVGLHRHRARVRGGHGPGARTGSRCLSRQREAVSTQAVPRGGGMTTRATPPGRWRCRSPRGGVRLARLMEQPHNPSRCRLRYRPLRDGPSRRATRSIRPFVANIA